MTVEAPPVVRSSAGWTFPVGAEHRLSNGVRLLAYHQPGQFVASISLLFDVPLSAEPRAVEGVAAMAARCLVRGAGGLSADDFADALAACGADLEASASPDGFAVHLSVPVTNLGRGLDLMAMAVSTPSYQAREFEQEQRLRLQEIEHTKAYPGSVTLERLNAELFGEARAGRPVAGSTSTVSAITLDDMTSYAARHLAPEAATLVVAGDFADVSLLEGAERSLGRWAGAGSDVPVRDPVVVRRAPKLVVVDWPDGPQATVRLAGPGITRADARWPALFVANYAVGGSFGSRLNTVLREQRGLTYGVGSNLDSGRQVGIFGVSANVKSAATAEAVGETIAILTAAAGSLSEAETSEAVRATTDSAPLGFERSAAVVSRVEMLLNHRLPLDHVDTNLARLRAVTVDEANATYADVVDPAALTVVVAASADVVAEPLAALGHAAVEVVARP